MNLDSNCKHDFTCYSKLTLMQEKIQSGIITPTMERYDDSPQEGWTITAQWASGPNRVCSPIVASNGTEFYVSYIFLDKPFEVIGTFINGTKPDDCHKIWKTETDLPGPDIDLAVWLENHYGDD